VLGRSLSELISLHIQPQMGRGLDVGCQSGTLTRLLAQQTGFDWSGVDPRVQSVDPSRGSTQLVYGWGHELPFLDGQFDCAVLANVYEHVEPQLRSASVNEIRRVLSDGGLLVGQLPNPYFPIESHSRLPFMGWLPGRMRKRLWRFAPVDWEHDFYTVTIHDLRRRAEAAGMETVLVRNFNYPPEVIPKRLRWAARLLDGPMQLVPWAWQFVFRRTR
jgi:SAM-dependent methyltransferase